jgi:NTP pyrophosphatase (non-canonical NTP hydrolase)
MTINEYQKLALRTSNHQRTFDLLVNGALGLCGEAGEVVDLIKKHCFQGHELDVSKIIIELGDVCWYIAALAHALNVDLETIMIRNIDKLKKRYPNGFSFEDSIHRAEVTD